MGVPTWLLEVQAVGPGLIGFGVIVISFQQFRVAARKLKLDLYQRRYEVFQALHAYMTTSGKLPPKTRKGSDDKPTEGVDPKAESLLAAFESARRKAYEKMAESRFLFDRATCDYIEKFVNNLSKFHNTNELLQSKDYEGMRVEMRALTDDHIARSMWIFNQYEPMVAAFSPSMKLDHAFGLKFKLPWFMRGEAKAVSS